MKEELMVEKDLEKSGKSKKKKERSRSKEPKRNSGIARSSITDGFEERSLAVCEDEEWDILEDLALDELDSSKGGSDRAFFFLGLALYKMEQF
jgi:hypothetical protein